MKESKCDRCEGVYVHSGPLAKYPWVCATCEEDQRRLVPRHMEEWYDKQAREIALIEDGKFMQLLRDAEKQIRLRPWPPTKEFQTIPCIGIVHDEVTLEVREGADFTKELRDIMAMAAVELDYLKDPDPVKQFPHCDQRVLHRPGECEFCDMHPDWQSERTRKDVNFTGSTIDTHPCPADEARGLAGAHVWGGNTPKKAGDKSSWVEDYSSDVSTLSCTCGADSVKSPHSDWCDKYEKR